MATLNNKPTLIFGGDHAGFQTRIELIKKFQELGFECAHLGCFDLTSCNYAQYAIDVGNEVVKNTNSLGIVVCGTGVGVCMAANKVNGILCGVAYNQETARLIKEHDNCNVLALGARQFDNDTLFDFCQIFINAKFEGGRHLERIEYIKKYENGK